MTTTTAQKLAQAQEQQQAIAAREEAIRLELAEVQKQQEANREKIQNLQQRQNIIETTVSGLADLDNDLFNEILAIATDARSAKTQPQQSKAAEKKPETNPQPEQLLEQLSEKPNIPNYLIDCLKSALEPFCLGIDETLENAALLHDYDNPGVSPGTLFYENNQFNPSQNLLKWLEAQKTNWEEMKIEIEKAIGKATEEKPEATEPEPDIFETPYQLIANNIFILIDPDNPTTGKLKIAQDMPRAYSVIPQGKEMILEITTSSGASTVRSSWNWETKFPKKYQPATRAVLKHYAQTPELLAAFNEQYPDAADLLAEAEQAKKDLFPEQYPTGYSEENPLGEGKAPSFQMNRA